MSTTLTTSSSKDGNRPAKKIGVYTIGQEIGKGSFATVYKCVNNVSIIEIMEQYQCTEETALLTCLKQTHESVAIKSVVRSKLKSKKLMENLEVEISILKSMKHPHIVGLLDYHQTTSHFHLVMDYCSMGDLSYFIRKRNQLVKTHPVITSLLERYPSPEGSHGLNEILVIHFLKQLASALEFLRDKSLVHRDIKPQNLLLCPPIHSKKEFEEANFVGLWELPIVKIADFGFARFLPSTSMAETLCGSPLYMAPEILRYEKYNAKADLWSVGAVLYEMTVGKPPFKAANHIELLKNIEKSNDKIKFPSAAQVPESLKRLIKSLLKYNPTERISFHEFFNDPLITCDLEGNDEPLETSEMDENLFISEYISPLKPNQQSQYIQPITEMSPKSKTSESQMKTVIVAKGNRSERDEEIKSIIDKNSPDPEGPNHLSNSHNNRSLVMKNRDDIILEKDYVVVEKRAVEVNAIADELAHAGSGALAINRSRQSTDFHLSNEAAKSTNERFRAGSSGSQRRPSITDRISISISPTSALSKAIGLASNRLFGTAANNLADDANFKLVSDNSGFPNPSNATLSTVISSPNFASNLLLQKVTLPSSSTMNANAQQQQKRVLGPDEEVLMKLESLATKAHAIDLFADVKFSQLIPSPPSSDDLDDNILHQNDSLPPKVIKSISEEGVVLYVKTLSLLAKGMSTASEWWYKNFDKEETSNIEDQKSLNLKSNSDQIQISVRINELVQWIREKFNESLEKAEFIRLRLQEANTVLAKELNETGDSVSFSDNTNRVIAEKLIFDRALEMSRNAAVNELVKEDLRGCELAYSTAIWMLEALIEDEPNESDERLDEDDKAMVEKFIISIGNRLSVLKKKLELV
ncbi:uncharacterized protein PRCAT00002365001 [Priceomyces carsonii]|uniref:uncharacterized protein n=1 Tax=Priceomyces carsonii TaxID=28549 RepID=UPI002ED8EEBE|nr:unnamed protein product [Priceomyces carsonii]